MSQYDANVTWVRPRSDYRLPLSVHVRDFAKWVNFQVRPRVRPDLQRFLIFGVGRSGSTVLATLLDSHPAVNCRNELLRMHRRFPIAYLERRAGKSPPEAAAFGFHLKPWHITRVLQRDPIAFVKTLDRLGYRFVHLVRENLFLKELSVTKLHAHGVIHAKTEERVPKSAFEVDTEFLLNQMRSGLAFEKLELACLEAVGQDHPTVVYERDLLRQEAHEATCARIFEFLDLAPHPVSSPLRKVSPRNWRHGVKNADEVAEAVERAGYGDYVRQADAL